MRRCIIICTTFLLLWSVVVYIISNHITSDIRNWIATEEEAMSEPLDVPDVPN